MDIFLDIETIPTSRDDIRARVSADVAPPGQYKKPESIAQWWAAYGDLEREEAIAKTALSGTFGEIFCIGYAVEDGPVHVVSRGDGTERSVLEDFAKSLPLAVERHDGPPTHDAMWEYRARWIGHNIEDFDLRFLWQRAIVNGLRLPFRLPLERYPKAPTRFDTMREWAGWSGRIKQTELELALGIARVDPITGADVWTHYKAGDYAAIVAHCEEDVRCLREIYNRMT
jgi:hypothetical protein